MQRFLHLWLRISSACILLLAGYNLHAQDEHYAAAPLRGNQLAPDSSSQVTDTVYFNPALKPIQTAWNIKNLITLQVDESYRGVLPDEFDVIVQYQIYYTKDDNGTPATGVTDTLSLEVGYSKFTTYGFKAIDVHSDGWYQAEVKIARIIPKNGTFSSFSNALVLTNEILLNRTYNFSCNANGIQSISSDTSTVPAKGELKVYWQPQRAATEYDLEWAYIDDSALANYRYGGSSYYNIGSIFTNNATRVTVHGEEYHIPLLYEGSGHLFYRVRAVQTQPNGQRMEADWSSNFTNGLGIYAFAGLDTSLNWQASTSFAEDGKRKSVVQYFDGSLKSRQTVTKDNTTDTTIVAETFYDFQGRPVIQVMPTPSLSSIIRYTPNFNRVNGAEYTKDLYDGMLQDSCFCRQGAPAMDSMYGAAQYYSPNNPLANSGYHQYIPNAHGFVFSETRYTADNTGRISQQSGVGGPFSIDSGRAVQYTYNAADQEELDALFGTEAGNASHYFKNTVRDANGQVSVSYVDMHGRTIASALAGTPAADLDALPSNNTVWMTKNLIDSSSNIIKGTTIENSKGLVVTKAGQHRFRYSLLPDSIDIQACDTNTICYDCIYDLQITISDECSNTTLNNNGQPVVITRTNYHLDTTAGAMKTLPAVDTTVYLREGSYLVTKTLTINKAAMEYYLDSIFLRRNTCSTLQQVIQQQQFILAQTSQCQPTCESCRANLGTQDQFVAAYMQQAGIPADEVSNYQAQAIAAYNAQLLECDKLCGDGELMPTIKTQMLADVTPPYGQYANPDSVDQYSVFWNTGGTPPYQLTNAYTDENGHAENPDPRSFDQATFIGSFKDSWAEILLTMHPEYPKWQKYQQFAASNKWDAHFGNTNSYQAAIDSGFLNPGNFDTHPAGNAFAYNADHRDPFFTDYTGNGVVPAGYKSQMQDSLLNRALDKNGNPVSMWSLATIMVHCPDKDGDCMNRNATMDSAFANLCSNDLDAAWKYFRDMYLQQKRLLLAQVLRDAQAQSTRFPNLTGLDTTSHYTNFYDPSVIPAGAGPIDSASANDSLRMYISTNCMTYVQQWWAQLKPCQYTSADSAVIIPQLLQVCQAGGDVDHLYGASTVKPGSANQYKSFEDVLKAYNAAHGKLYDATCNVYLIDAPRPYDLQPTYYAKAIYQKPDSCECATIGRLYQQYQAQQTGYTFSGYLYYYTGTVISDGALDTLRMACNGQINCNYLATPMSLPPALQCGGKNACVNCMAVDTLYISYRNQFPDALPAKEESDSVQRYRNALFAGFMNQKLGFSKTAQEYLAFIDTCQDFNTNSASNSSAGCIGCSTWNCDALTQIYNVYQQQKWRDTTHFQLYQIGSKEIVYPYMVFGNGVAHMPDSIVGAPSDFGEQYFKMDTLCVDNEFTVETRIKRPIRDTVNRSVYFQLHFNDDFNLDKIAAGFFQLKQNATAADSALILAKCGTIGYGRAGTYTPATHPIISDFSDWVVIKYTHSNDSIWRVYYNDTLVSQRYIPNRVYRLIGFEQLFGGHIDKGWVDYYKVYDKNHQLQYVEEFEDYYQSPSNEPAAFTCPGVEAAKFAQYFSRVTGTAYTSAQVDSIYQATGCISPFGTAPAINCDTLSAWLNGYQQYGGIPHLDASGADTTHWKVDFGGPYYTAGVPLGEVIKNGVMGFPAYYADTVNGYNHVDFDYEHDSLCLDPSGFTFETRIKLPDSLVSSNFYHASWWLTLYSDTTSGAVTVGTSPLNGQGVAVCSQNGGPSKKVCANESIPGEHFNDWRVMKLQFRGRSFKLYIDDSLMAQRTLDAPMTKLYNWTTTSWGLKGQVDYIRIYDTASKMLYDEEFNDATHLAVGKSVCANCADAFTNYYNQRSHSSLTWQQIQAKYAGCGIPLHLCNTEMPPLTLCGSASPVFAPQTTTQPPHSSCDDSTLFATSTATVIQDAYTDSIRGNFSDRYLAKCLGARYHESFSVVQPVSEYHYTLYYYDQAGNLVKTIPPAGVDMSKFDHIATWSDSVRAARRIRQVLTPHHQLPTQYRFNTLNQVVAQQSPDGGLSEFWYDRIGRLSISRNARQMAAAATEDNRLYSYTNYDALGRITEVGQVSNLASNGGMTDDIARNESALNGWLATLGNRRGQMTNTVYDLPYIGFEGAIDPRLLIGQRNLRNRVSYITHTDTSLGVAYNQGTFYSYNILGNIDTLLQDYGSGSFPGTANIMNVNENRFKKIAYNFDLITGKVNMVMYQHGRRDGFYHRYNYDAENRLTSVETSTDSLVWERDARYEYYRHGPLARTEIGDQQVQGIDYAYTLQGWLKGINSTGGTAANDIGGDGNAGNLHQYTATDAIGLTLNYFGKDYAAISNQQAFPAYSGLLPVGEYRPLYNGNISSQSIYQKRFEDDNFPGGPLIFYNYKYDQLNRLTRQDAYKGFSNNAWALNSMGDYLKERIAYDANGNILSYLRKSIGTTTAGSTADMDSLNYYYYANTNQLKRITDGVPDNTFESKDNLIADVKNQPDSNYVYDAIGNLIKDSSEKITNIQWDVYGKIKQITRIPTTNSPASLIQYTYDAHGYRIGQMTIIDNTKYYNWYIRDASGNILTSYSAQGGLNDDLASVDLKHDEQYIYGSSRLGSYSIDESVDGGPDDMQYYRGNGFNRGLKQYELTNQLNNVLAVVSDRKFGIPSGSNNSLIDHYEPHIVAAQDYYPFGMISRFAAPSDGKYYKFGFNGKFNDNGAKGLGNQQDYGMRIYDPRVGRFLSVDPITRNYPGLTPYQFGSNRPIDGVDQDGLEWRRASPNNGNAIDATAIQSGIDPSRYVINPLFSRRLSAYPIVLAGGDKGIAPPSNRWATITQWEPSKNDYDRQQQKATNEKNWLDAGYLADGKESFLGKLEKNNTWNSLANNLAIPVMKAYSTITPVLEVREILIASDKLIRVGQWMTSEMYEQMITTGRVVEEPGQGGLSFFSTAGPQDWGKTAGKGYVYAEFDVAKTDVLQAGKTTWLKAATTRASNVKQLYFVKEGANIDPIIKNLSEIKFIRGNGEQPYILNYPARPSTLKNTGAH